ncbi:hypothetical protein [Niallia endozanthoxylica]|uniref:hypothetical protein n=1 Tax=Niallia endozanthoxylica TaxID=2036016 RepID=UPI00168BE6A8|nr:hypothetical protein [Niallia endozanthoxylica]
MEEVMMWVITAYVGEETKIYEFKTEKEAKEALKSIKGYTILTEVISFYNRSVKLVAV